VLAFQKLWNRNNPGDKIGEDGAYGPQTEARLKKSPATGFATGASCTTSSHASNAVVASVDGPDRVAPGQSAHFTLTVRNTGDAMWPSGTRLVAPDATLHDASWDSSTEITSMGGEVPAGTLATFEIDVVAPNATAETAVFQQLMLQDDTHTYATFDIAMTVSGVDTGDSADAADPEAEITGGCSAGGGGGAGLILALGLVLRGRGRSKRGA